MIKQASACALCARALKVPYLLQKKYLCVNKLFVEVFVNMTKTMLVRALVLPNWKMYKKVGIDYRPKLFRIFRFEFRISEIIIIM